MNKKIVSIGSIAVVAAFTTIVFAQNKSIDELRIKVAQEELIGKMQENGQSVSDEEKTQLRDGIVQQLTRFDRFKDVAIKKGLDKKPEVQAAYKNMEASFYSMALAEDYQKTLKVTDEELKSTHRMLNSKYKLAEIQFSSEKEAYKAIDSLGKGKSFESLAQEIQKDSYIAVDQLTELSIYDVPPEALTLLLDRSEGYITSKPLMMANGTYALIKIESVKRGEPISDEDFKEHKNTLLLQTKSFLTQRYLEGLLDSK